MAKILVWNVRESGFDSCSMHTISHVHGPHNTSCHDQESAKVMRHMVDEPILFM